MDEFEKFLENLKLLKVNTPEPNFFHAGGRGHLENKLSDTMAVFMGSQLGAPRWLAKALLACLSEKVPFDSQILDEIDWENVEAEREVACSDGGRLDLVVSDGNFVLGIEHKVFASARQNPFDKYSEMLESRAQGSGIATPIKCVLRPNESLDGIPQDWLVIPYTQLVEKAFSLYTQDVAQTSVTKWQAFYQELLLHLKSIANCNQAKIMSKEDFELSLKNYPHLIKANGLLKKFEIQLRNEGVEYIHQKIETANIKSSRIHDLIEGYKVIRFYPDDWNDRAHVMLVLAEADLTMDGFYVQACIKVANDAERDQIKENFEKDAENNVFWQKRSGEEITWPESLRGDQLLILSVWPKECTKDSAMAALAELAKWVQENAFQESSYPALEPL